MTMPTLMSNYRKHVVETKLAKFYSTINQAVNMSVAHNGEVKSWFKDCGMSTAPTCTNDEAIEWFNTYIGKYMRVEDIKEAEGSSGFYVYFSDGSVMRMRAYLYDIHFFTSKKAMDNEQTGINKFYFRFMPVLTTGSELSQNKYTVRDTVEPYVFEWNGTTEELYDESNVYSCAGEKHIWCTKLIQMNGWKIPKDYPLKF